MDLNEFIDNINPFVVYSHQDEYLYKKYSRYYFENTYKEWDVISKIIFLDQVLRNIRRVDSKIVLKDDEAVFLTTSFIDNIKYHINQIENNEMREEIFLFCLMPYRHTFKYPFLKKIIDILNEYNYIFKSVFYKKFKRATFKSYSKSIILKKERENVIKNFDDIIDEKCEKYIDQNIFIEKDNSLIKYFENLFKYSKKKYTISLSGGVDSMVCLYILFKLKKVKQAVHICYNNRKECNLEKEFLRMICYKLNVPLYIRNITSIKRNHSLDFHENSHENPYEKSHENKTDREFYEEITRIFRFDSYSQFKEDVITGHNLTDCFENEITNLNKNIKFDNLSGMEMYSEEMNVRMIRPLLNIHKEQIFEFAMNNNIPFLRDTTKKFTQRYKLRELVFPKINEHFPNFSYGLHSFTKAYSENWDIILSYIIEPFLEEIDYSIRYFIPIKNTNILKEWSDEIWRYILRQICILNNFKTPKNKIIKELLKSFKNIDKKEGKFLLLSFDKINRVSIYLVWNKEGFYIKNRKC